MARYEYARVVDIDASPEAVYAVMVDVERWPEWTGSVTRIVRVDKGPFVVGSRARIQQPRLPPALWKVSAIDPGRAFTWVSGGPGMRVTAHHTIEPHAGGSRVMLSVRYDGLLTPVLDWFTRDLNERYLAMEADGLKARCEKSS